MKKLLTSAAIAMMAVSVNAQVLYDNGPYFNSVGTGFAGANESVLYTTTFGMGTIGFGHQSAVFNRIADDFVNPNCIWQIDSIVFFAYQTGSTTASTFTGVNFRIWDTVPDAVGSSVVYGDTTTNRLTRTVWSGAYRITETTTGNTTRPIMRNVCSTPGLTLQAGTFWIDWASLGSLASGPWAPARTPANVAVTGNGRQRIGSTWNNALDGGTGTPAQGFPFIIYGTIVEPTANAGSDISFCLGDSAMIGGSPSGNGGTGVLTYAWSNPTALNNATASNPNAAPTATSTFVLTVTDALACVDTDTMVFTVRQPSVNSLSPTVCNSYLSPEGNTYTTSGTYMDTLTNAVGCDSVITINLTVNTTTTANISPVVCNMYTAPSGSMHMTSGVFNDTIANASGCDSVITINLTVNTPTSATINQTACFSYTLPSGAMVTSSGTVMDTIPNVNGCDSVMTFNVTINTVDTGVSMSGVILTADAAAATYQWIYCDSANAPVAGATSQSFMPLVDGNYAVIVTENSCSDTSACILVLGTGMGNTVLDKSSMSPNPTSGNVVLMFGVTYNEVTVIVTDAQGRTVYTEMANGVNRMEMNPSLESGIYFVNIYADGNATTKQLIRQ